MSGQQPLQESKRDPWWAIVAVVLLAGVWGFAVGVLATVLFPSWNFYIVWLAAWGLAINACVYKVARRER